MTKQNKKTSFDKDAYLYRLVNELPVLRSELGLSQNELAGIIDVSRQTYSSIETGRRKMSWDTYLSLIFVFDNNKETHEHIRNSGLFPYSIIRNTKMNTTEQLISDIAGMNIDEIKNCLDKRAIHTIETVIKLEYARCNNMSGDEVIKAFDGKRASKAPDNNIKD